MDRRSRPKPKKIKGAKFNQGQVRVAASANVRRFNYPIFCFRHLVSGYSIDDCSKDEKAHFVSKIVKMAGQTWNDLMTGSHWSGAGFEQIPKSQIGAALPAIITEDVEKVYVMRFHGKAHRMIGHRSDEVFHVTHIDPNLSAYKH